MRGDDDDDDDDDACVTVAVIGRFNNCTVSLVEKGDSITATEILHFSIDAEYRAGLRLYFYFTARPASTFSHRR